MQSDVSHCHLDTEELLSGIPGGESRSWGSGERGLLIKRPQDRESRDLGGLQGQVVGHWDLAMAGGSRVSPSQLLAERQLAHL